MNYGACYQTLQALIDALVDATDAQDLSRTDADRQQQQQEQAPHTSVAQQQPIASQTTTTTSTNRQQRQNTQVSPNGIIIDGLPMEQYMANICELHSLRNSLFCTTMCHT